MLVLDTGRNAAIWRVEFSPDGTMLVASYDVAPTVWNIAVQQRLNLKAAGTYFWNGTHASFHPSGRWLIGTGIGKGGPLIHDFEKQKNWHEPIEGRIEVACAAFTPDGKTVVYSAERMDGSAEFVCRPWKANGTLGGGWTVPLEIDLDLDERNGLTILADNKRFATAHYTLNGGRVVIRSLTDGETLQVVNFPIAKTNSTPELVVAPDDSIFVARSQNVLHIWNAGKPGWPCHAIKDPSLKHFTGIGFHPSGKYLAATSNDETVKLYDTSNWEVTRTFTWDIGKMRSIAFSPDGTLAAAGSDAGKVVVWDVDV